MRITNAGTAAGVGDSCTRPRCRRSPSEFVRQPQQQQQIEPEEERPSNHQNPEMKMFIKIALAAVIVVSAAAMASAATRSHKSAVYRSDPRAQATVPRTPRFSNPDSPAATGGGSLGYNQNIYNW